MRQAAAKGAAHSNRVVRDMVRNGAQQCAERIFGDRFVKRRMTHTGADRKDLAVTRDLVEADDVVDVDEVGGLSQPKCHNRDEALAARQHAAVLRRHFGQNLKRLIEGLRRMANERRRLHY